MKDFMYLLFVGTLIGFGIHIGKYAAEGCLVLTTGFIKTILNIGTRIGSNIRSRRQKNTNAKERSD
jgi:hypothetical protein